jgi:hypothetical protein
MEMQRLRAASNRPRPTQRHRARPGGRRLAKRRLLCALWRGYHRRPLTLLKRTPSPRPSSVTSRNSKPACWDCEILAERMKSELVPPVNMLFVDPRGEAARVVFDAQGERRILH